MLGRLRTRLNVVLVSPDIPGNTGSIGRTVMAVGGCLHLVHPLGFKTDETALRRAGLDYWRQLDLMEHESWDAFPLPRVCRVTKCVKTSQKRHSQPLAVHHTCRPCPSPLGREISRRGLSDFRQRDSRSWSMRVCEGSAAPDLLEHLRQPTATTSARAASSKALPPPSGSLPARLVLPQRLLPPPYSTCWWPVAVSQNPYSRTNGLNVTLVCTRGTTSQCAAPGITNCITPRLSRICNLTSIRFRAVQ